MESYREIRPENLHVGDHPAVPGCLLFGLSGSSPTGTWNMFFRISHGYEDHSAVVES